MYPHNVRLLRYHHNNIFSQGVYRPSERLEATDIDGYLAHNHDLIILSAVDEARRGAEDDVREISRRFFPFPFIFMLSFY
jgi:hypothetical protein